MKINNIKIIDNKKHFKEQELQELFASCGWDSSEQPELLVKAFFNASNVVCAYANDKLIGIARIMDDGSWSSNIDCFIVHKDYQGQGIGTKIIQTLIKKLSNVKYINVCPDKRKNISFYKRFGFKKIRGCYLQKRSIE